MFFFSKSKLYHISLESDLNSLTSCFINLKKPIVVQQFTLFLLFSHPVASKKKQQRLVECLSVLQIVL